MAHYVFTSESVTNGHPDKVCDQVSDAVLDAILAQDPMGRVACETCCTTGMVMVMGEVTTTATVDIQKIAREVVCGIGYDNASAWFDGNTCAVLTALDEQSADIDMGVSRSFELKEGEQDEYNLHGAGDQGMMFGFACDETPEYMPMPISFARKLTNRLTALREDGTLPYLRPDGKSQVTVEYDENHRPVRVDTVVVSTQHSADVPLETIRKDIVEQVIRPVIPAELLDEKTVFYVNPTGRFVIGGPHGDSGLTGRKIIVDTYGGYARHGGLLRQGSDQGGSFCRLCCTLRCQKHRCRRSCDQVRGGACLRHRCGEARFRVGRDVRHGKGGQVLDCFACRKALRPASCGDHQDAGSAPPDLS